MKGNRLSEYRKPISRKKQDLGYLCEDVNRKIAKLRDWNDDKNLKPYQLDAATSLLREIACLDLGFEVKLNDLQYCFGEMQVYSWEGSEQNLLLTSASPEFRSFWIGTKGPLYR